MSEPLSQSLIELRDSRQVLYLAGRGRVVDPAGKMVARQPFPVGRICHDKTVFFGMGEGFHGPCLEMDQIFHPRKPGVLPGGLDGGGVDIVALQVCLHGQIDHLFRLLPGVRPESGGDQVGPFLGREMPPQARSDTSGNHGGFDDEGAAAAEGIHQDAPRLPGGQHQKACRQVLCDGSLDALQTVAPFVEGIPCGIDGAGHFVLLDKDPDRIGGPGLGEVVDQVFLLHPLHHGLFHDRLDVGGGEEPALYAGGLGDPETALSGQIFLPGQGQGPLEEVLPGLGAEGAHL